MYLSWEGEAEATIGDIKNKVKAGFISYTGKCTLKCIVVDQRIDHDVRDYLGRIKGSTATRA